MRVRTSGDADGGGYVLTTAFRASFVSALRPQGLDQTRTGAAQVVALHQLEDALLVERSSAYDPDVGIVDEGDDRLHRFEIGNRVLERAALTRRQLVEMFDDRLDRAVFRKESGGSLRTDARDSWQTIRGI